VRLAAVSVIVAAIAAIPAPAYALASLATGFDADTVVFGGLAGQWFPRMQQLGSSWVRIPAAWNAIAPTRPRRPQSPADPAYDWSYLDAAVREAAATRQHVLLMLASPPGWALGAHAPRSAWPGTWRPDASAYGAFARAAARRYSGRFPDPAAPGRALPRVSYFQVWNEPNLRTWLSPQWTRRGRRWLPASPDIYRGLLDAAYAGVKTVQPRAHVLAAGLAPYGDPPGVDRMHPVTFLRELLCLHGEALRRGRCPVRAHLDGVDVHPYALTPTIHALSPDDVSVPDLGRLGRVLRAAGRAHTVLPRGGKPIWITEIAWDSSPPDPAGVPVATQARYVSETLYEAWRQGTTHVMWYEARDLGHPAKSFTGAGLFYASGQPKPSALAFRFPFVAIRGPHGAATIWGRAPRPGAVTIEISRGGWRRLARIRTTRGGIFYGRLRLSPHTALRARQGATTSETA
jgi:hypothetical protein